MARSQISMLLLTCILVFLLAPMTEVIGFEGFGTTTSGGNNYEPPVVVNSLADSGSGTLREALSGGNRRIVFSVGGTIMLQSALTIRGKSSITIDGSTAPPPGITLHGYGLEIRTSNNIIVTHLRVRNTIYDGILVWDGSYKVVIDHCSVTDSGDENIGITEATSDVTVSWCIIGDTRPDWVTRKVKGMLITNFNKGPVTNVSLHHNLFTHEHQRSPEISTAGLFDLRNNVLKEWWYYGMRLRNGVWGNIINNVFVTSAAPQRAIMLEAAGPVHIKGNQGPGSTNVNALSTSSTPFPVAPVTTDPVAEVEQKVLQGAGAFPRDAIDTALAGPANRPPVADAGLDQTTSVGETPSFNGTGSTDPDGDPLTYIWDFGDGNTATGAVVTHTYQAPGTYTVTLTVDDGKLSDSDTAAITVTSSNGCVWANLARCATASASSVWSSSYSAAKANDGSGSTRWNSASGDRVGAWLALDFGVPTTLDTIVLKEAFGRITGHTLQYWDGAAWRDIVVGTTIGTSKTHTFAPLTAEWVRLVVTSLISGTASVTPTLYEFEVYGE